MMASSTPLPTSALVTVEKPGTVEEPVTVDNVNATILDELLEFYDIVMDVNEDNVTVAEDLDANITMFEDNITMIEDFNGNITIVDDIDVLMERNATIRIDENAVRKYLRA